MDARLIRLINDYQKVVHRSVELMRASGIAMPRSGSEWARTDMPQSGVLGQGSTYYKHGFGCTVWLPTGAVDFDFGEHGEINGFDSWRLRSFAKLDPKFYEFETVESIQNAFDDAVQFGAIFCPEPTVCYLKGCERRFAIEVSVDRPGDKLPHMDHDEILTLHAQCFLAADLMRLNYRKLLALAKKRTRLSQSKAVEARIYGTSWLAYLAATSEGFRKLNMRRMLITSRPVEFLELVPKCDSIGKLMKAHYDALRVFRNNVFHLQDGPRPIIKFFADDSTRMSWAESLHDSIDDFFSGYRILCECHYAEQERTSESFIRAKKYLF